MRSAMGRSHNDVIVQVIRVNLKTLKMVDGSYILDL